ncbi:type 1 glutamine amidotransferase domain-containing protein [Bacillus salacetis]|uniref:type 1 glutamine amidotransferase domain-containing protein n=1 Tax=Bacillus salacetis TaxID=2315464 RepID=UPI003B9E256D
MKKILIVLTNTEQMDKEHQTGLWLSEFAEPYVEFTNRGYSVSVASIEGGRVPVDPRSTSEGEMPPDEWEGAIRELESTLVLSQVNVNDFNGIFLPGGHGTMFDLPGNTALQKALAHFAENDKLIGAVCHGPAGFVDVKLSSGKSLVEGKRITGFTNEEEQQMDMDSLMPFLLESKLRENGADFQKGSPFTDFTVTDTGFVTGQNPQSGLSTAKAFAEQLQ